MRVLICGGRDYNDFGRVERAMEVVQDNYYARATCIISGHARGADRLGEDYAAKNDLELEIYPAKWDVYGKSAGYKRNVQMAEEGKPNVILAMPGGRGTDMMIKIGIDKKIDTVVVNKSEDTLKWVCSKALDWANHQRELNDNE
jgi:hypothetical protein